MVDAKASTTYTQTMADEKASTVYTQTMVNTKAITAYTQTNLWWMQKQAQLMTCGTIPDRCVFPILTWYLCVVFMFIRVFLHCVCRFSNVNV